MADETPFPLARGERRPWDSIPPSVRSALEMSLGGRVIEATMEPEGFSPAVASRVALSNGRRCFIKAASSDPNPTAPLLYRAEARVAAALPTAAPVPRLLHVYDDGDWVALVFEQVEGSNPVLPWTEPDLVRALEAVAELGQILTPSPLPVAAIGATDARFFGWARIANDPTGLELSDPLVAWAIRSLDRLTALEGDIVRAVAGETLCHGDIRADNMLMTTGGVVFVDWAWAALGASWFDLVSFLPSVGMQGGPRPAILFDRFGPASAKAHDVDVAIAGIAGFFLDGSRQPPPPGLPTLRPFQRMQAMVALDWLQSRT